MTKTLLHLTDIHLNFVHNERFLAFCRSVNETKADYVVITGDISEAPSIVQHMKDLEYNIHIPIFFVLGNHDYYHGSINEVRVDMDMRHHFKGNVEENAAYWLPACEFISLSEKTAIVGHDGWYDGGYADWFTSQVQMTDYRIINEFQSYYHNEHYDIIRGLAGEAANHIRKVLPLALEKHDHVFVATHVPPYRENAVYMGKISDDDWMPHFSSKLMGDAIVDVMKKYPNKEATVLCGHSHGSAVYKPINNVLCVTGFAQYKYPGISGTFQFD
jgi:predicted MPP superfamily phosphohydrolase